MASKLSAARIASWSGIRTVIARASRERVLVDAVDAVDAETQVGTTFLGRDRQLSARRLWIAFAAQSVGRVVIDAGAVAAIETRGTSLLSPGVTHVVGEFAVGDVVDVVDNHDNVVARGASAMSSGELAAIRGKRSSDLAEGASSLVVHRDEMVVLSALR
jgi:glutamate 5-kinase